MRIQVTGGEHDLDLTLPNKLLFSKFVLGTVLKHSSLRHRLEGISPDTVARLVEELNRVKKRYGAWELVEVHTADGEIVKITL